MSLPVVGSLALTLALLLGTFLITHGYTRAGCLYLACLQVPAGAYDVATGQYGFVLMSLVGGVLYLRGWRRKEARELEKPRVLRRRAQQPQSFADGTEAFNDVLATIVRADEVVAMDAERTLG